MLVAADHTFTIGATGLPLPSANARQCSLLHSFCEHVVITGVPLILPDTRTYPHAHDAAALQDSGVVAYLGVPLTGMEGQVVGCVCVVDTVPQMWGETEGQLLSDIAALVASHLELQALRRAQGALSYRASHDALTDLPDGAIFSRRLTDALAVLPYRQDTVAVLFLDIDDFKAINDRWGHAAGDQILIAVAQRLSRSVRPQDAGTRRGGDEFTMLLTGLANGTEAREIATRLCVRLRAPYTIDGATVHIGVSVGLALNHLARDRSEDLLRDADAAMYRAKRAGKAHHDRV